MDAKIELRPKSAKEHDLDVYSMLVSEKKLFTTARNGNMFVSVD